ncbi:MAG TPA: PilN domain-containing protein [Gemmatimonadaceae bacterium]|nr:PilN domain-containing protein [Gemmatimonadaceae bacterium]
MISINLLPGSGKKSRGRAGPSIDLGALFATFAARVKDPYLAAAVGTGAVSIAAVVLLYTTQAAKAARLTDAEQKAVQDSTRYAAVLKEKRRWEAQRDSLNAQIKVIRAIDDDRFVWPHILDEVSRALPPYTWLTQVGTVLPQTAPQVVQRADTSRKAAADSVVKPVLQFQLVGNTVDIQALTRFMRVLEASPFLEDIEMKQTMAVLIDNREITQFTLTMAYQRPDSSVLRTVPVTFSR